MKVVTNFTGIANMAPACETSGKRLRIALSRDSDYIP